MRRALSGPHLFATLAVFAKSVGKAEDHDDDSPQRKNILRIVQASPGLPVGVLLDQTQLGWGTLYFHLAKMVKAGSIEVARVGRRRLVYPAGSPQARERAQGDALIHGKTARAVAEVILAEPGISIQGISIVLGQSHRVVYYHVRRLMEAGLVTSSSPTRHRDLCASPKLRAALDSRRPEAEGGKTDA
ncbi:MAG: hypothetical protein QOE90_1683 [Thermoplasmata archaeon]|jgi:predicted transcriptional regulator|nr:hypothetical protein [Thermoplasmata archaeon]